jgi:hypothetical protein
MSRQVGTVLGIGLLVVLLGGATGYEETHAAFQRAWWAVAVLAAVTRVAALRTTPRAARH